MGLDVFMKFASVVVLFVALVWHVSFAVRPVSEIEMLGKVSKSSASINSAASVLRKR